MKLGKFTGRKLVTLLLAVASLATTSVMASALPPAGKKVFTELETESETLWDHEWLSSNRIVSKPMLAPQTTWFTDAQIEEYNTVRVKMDAIKAITIGSGIAPADYTYSWNAGADQDGDGLFDDTVVCYTATDTIYEAYLSETKTEYQPGSTNLVWKNSPCRINSETGIAEWIDPSAPTLGITQYGDMVTKGYGVYFALEQGTNPTTFYIYEADQQVRYKYDAKSSSGTRLYIDSVSTAMNLNPDSKYMFGSEDGDAGFSTVALDIQIPLGEVKDSVTDLTSAFKCLNELQGLDLTNLDLNSKPHQFSNAFMGNSKMLYMYSGDPLTVQDANAAFYYCTNLKYVNNSAFDLTQAQNLSGMFQTTDLAIVPQFFNTTLNKCTSMQGVFSYTSNLVKADLSNMKVPMIDAMSQIDGYSATFGMFMQSTALKQLYCPNMLYFGPRFAMNCEALTDIAFPHTAAQNVYIYHSPTYYSTWDGIVNSDSYPYGPFAVPNETKTKLTTNNHWIRAYDWCLDNRYFDIPTLAPGDTWWNEDIDKSSVKHITISDSYTPGTSDVYWPAGVDTAGNINGTVGCYLNTQGELTLHTYSSEDQKLYMNENSKDVFNGFTNAEFHQLSRLAGNSAKPVTTLEGAFKNCGKLNSVALPWVSVTKITSLKDAFSGCSGLTDVNMTSDLSGKFTALATAEGAFENCVSLVKTKLPIYSGTPLTNATRMFRNCKKLPSVTKEALGFELASSSTVNATSMFEGCTSLYDGNADPLRVDFGKFKVGIADRMFKDCTKLTIVDFYITESGSDCNMSSVTSTISMFENCTLLQQIILPSTLLNIDSKFAYNCPQLTILESYAPSSADLGLPVAGTSDGFVYTDTLTPILVKTDNTQLRDYMYLNDNRDVTLKSISLQPVSIEVVKNPDKLTYATGEDFNPVGGKYKINYEDGSSKEIDHSNVNLSYPNGDDLTDDVTEVIINYNESPVDVQTTVPVTVSKKPDKIEIIQMPDKTKYEPNEEFDPEGLKVEVFFTDGTSIVVEPVTGMPPEMSLEPLGGLPEGLDGVTVKYTGGDTTEEVKVPIQVLARPVGVEVIVPPNKTVYAPGMDPDLTGMKIKVTYSHGVTKTSDDPGIDENVHQAVVEAIKAGDTKIDLVYSENGYDVPFSTPITVRQLSGIRVVVPPTKTAYLAGEGFDNTGMIVEASYTNGQKVTLTYGSNPVKDTDYFVVGGTVADANYTPLSGSQTSVTIYFTENGIRKETTQKISVSEAVGLVIIEQPGKTTYVAGQTFDKTGMIVGVEYSNGETKIVTNYTVSPTTGLTLGTDFVTVSYDDPTKRVSAKVPIKVIQKAPATVTREQYDMTSSDYQVVEDWNSVTVTVLNPKIAGINIDASDVTHLPKRQQTWYLDASHGTPVINSGKISFYGLTTEGIVTTLEVVDVNLHEHELQIFDQTKWSDRSIYMQFKDSTSPYYIDGYAYQINYGDIRNTSETGKAVLNQEGENVVSVYSYGYDGTKSRVHDTILKIDRSAPIIDWDIEEIPNSGTARIIFRATDDQSGIDFIEIPIGGKLKIGEGTDVNDPAIYKPITSVESEGNPTYKLYDTTEIEYVLPGNEYYTISAYNNAGLRSSKTFDLSNLKADYYLQNPVWLSDPVKGMPVEFAVTVGAKKILVDTTILRIEYLPTGTTPIIDPDTGRVTNGTLLHQEAISVTTDKPSTMKYKLDLPTVEESPTLVITVNPEGIAAEAVTTDNITTLNKNSVSYDFAINTIYVDNINVTPGESFEVELGMTASGLTQDLTVPVDFYTKVNGIETLYSTELVTFGPSATNQTVVGLVTAPVPSGVDTSNPNWQLGFEVIARVNWANKYVEQDVTNNEASITNMNASKVNLSVNINDELVVNGFTYGYHSSVDEGLFVLETLNLTETIDFIVVEGTKYTPSHNDDDANIADRDRWGIGTNVANFRIRDISSGDQVPVTVCVKSADGKYTKEYNIYLTKFTGDTGIDVEYTYTRNNGGTTEKITETRRFDPTNKVSTIRVPGNILDIIDVRINTLDEFATINSINGNPNTNPLKNTALTQVTVDPSSGVGQLNISVGAPGGEIANDEDYSITFSKNNDIPVISFVNGAEVTARTYGTTGFLQGGVFQKYGPSTSSVVQAERDGVTSGMIIHVRVNDPNVDQLLRGYVELGGKQYPITWDTFNGPTSIKACDATDGYVNIPITKALDGNYPAKIVVQDYRDTDMGALSGGSGSGVNIISFTAKIDTSTSVVSLDVEEETVDALGNPTGNVTVNVVTPNPVTADGYAEYSISGDGGLSWKDPTPLTTQSFVVSGAGSMKVRVTVRDALGNESTAVETIVFRAKEADGENINIYMQKTRLADYYYVGTNKDSEASVSGEHFNFVD